MAVPMRASDGTYLYFPDDMDDLEIERQMYGYETGKSLDPRIRKVVPTDEPSSFNTRPDGRSSFVGKRNLPSPQTTILAPTNSSADWLAPKPGNVEAPGQPVVRPPVADKDRNNDLKYVHVTYEKLSSNFSLDQLIQTQEQAYNYPSDENKQKLRNTAWQLEKVRDLIGDIHVNSGYRSDEVNKLVYGKNQKNRPTKSPAHLAGYAVDFVPPKGTSVPEAIRRLEKSGIQYDRIGNEGNRVHISFHPDMNGVTFEGTPETGYRLVWRRPKK